MSFKFNFDIDDIDQENDVFETIQNEKQEEKKGTEMAEPFRELKIEDLVRPFECLLEILCVD